MKVKEVIKWLSQHSNQDEHIIINWWDYDDLIASGGSKELTLNEWKHLVNRINGKADWSYVFDAAIDESHNIVAQREDLFKDKSEL